MPSPKLISLLIIVLWFLACQESGHFDTIILNGNVYDGKGNPAQQVDVGIIGEEIVKMGNLKAATADKLIDATNLAVVPGFIDLHTHLDPIFELSTCESHIRQGVTTALGGPDGGGPWPFGAYLDSLQKIGVGMNVGFLTGHNVIRRNVMQLENRAPTDEELEKNEDASRSSYAGRCFWNINRT